MGHEVFISYAFEDKLVADAICAKLEENKIRCWIAPRDITPGDKYAPALLNAIDHSQVIIVVFSSKADKSPHVRNEIERAFNKEKIIIPFRIENIEPCDEMQYFIGSRHWLDALTPPLEDHITKLTQFIKKILDNKPESEEKLGTSLNTGVKTKIAESPADRSTLSKIYPKIIISIIAIGLILGLSIVFFSSSAQTLLATNVSNPVPSPETLSQTQEIPTYSTSTNLLKGNWSGFYNTFYRSSNVPCDFNYKGKLIWNITSIEGNSFSGDVYLNGLEYKYGDCSVARREDGKGTVKGKIINNSIEGIMDHTSSESGDYNVRKFTASLSEGKIFGDFFSTSNGIKDGTFTLLK